MKNKSILRTEKIALRKLKIWRQKEFKFNKRIRRGWRKPRSRVAAVLLFPW